jgi:hypothetical protein
MKKGPTKAGQEASEREEGLTSSSQRALIGCQCADGVNVRAPDGCY